MNMKRLMAEMIALSFRLGCVQHMLNDSYRPTNFDKEVQKELLIIIGNEVGNIRVYINNITEGLQDSIEKENNNNE